MVNRRTISFTLVLALASLFLLLPVLVRRRQGRSEDARVADHGRRPGGLQRATNKGRSGVFRAGAFRGGCRGKGELTPAGIWKSRSTGLVFAEGANAGNNTVSMFRGLVSCLNDMGGAVNFLTGRFHCYRGCGDSGGGNADIEAKLDLPTPCIAPIVFVTTLVGRGSR